MMMLESLIYIVLGLGIIGIFLVVLMTCVRLMEKWTEKSPSTATVTATAIPTTTPSSSVAGPTPTHDLGAVTAAISVALAHHRKLRKG